jgi:hypothetical protein
MLFEWDDVLDFQFFSPRRDFFTVFAGDFRAFGF